MKKSALIVISLSLCNAALAASYGVSRAEMKGDWPLTVESGFLDCKPLAGSPKLKVVTFKTGGKTYALNGIAEGQAKARGWLSIDEIWSDNPEIEGAKKNIRALVEKGLSYCK